MERKIKRFVNRVLREVYLKNEYRQRVAEDLYSHICEAAAERPLEDVLKEMGHPRKIAADIMRAHADDYDKMGFWNAARYASHVRNFEIKSKTRIGDWPLVHVATGYNPETGARTIARGVIAVGDIAVGAVAFGIISAGIISIGAISAGVFALGAVALALVLGLGSVTLSGLVALGAVAFAGALALGTLSVSLWAAIGKKAIALYYVSAEGTSRYVPAWLQWLADLFRSSGDLGWWFFILLPLMLVAFAIAKKRTFRLKL